MPSASTFIGRKLDDMSREELIRTIELTWQATGLIRYPVKPDRMIARLDAWQRERKA